MARVTGEMAETLRTAGLPCDVAVLQGLDPYAIIDLAAAIASGDDDSVAEAVGWLDTIIVEQLTLISVSRTRPDTGAYGQHVESGQYHSLYTRAWSLYRNDAGTLHYVIRHTHAGDNCHGIDTEWFVFRS